MPSVFDRAISTARPHLPGSLDSAIKLELFPLLVDFFQNSNVWRESIDFTILAGTKSVAVTPTAGRINNLLYVLDENGAPARGYFMRDRGTVETRIAPTNNITLTGVFGIVPADPVDVDSYPIIPGPLVEQYQETITEGIIARMMAQPSKPYSNVSLAQYHLSKYRGGTSRARNDMNEGNTYGSQRWQYPRSFATRG